MAWKQIAHTFDGPITQLRHRFYLSHDCEGVGTCAPREYGMLHLTHYQVEVGEFACEAGGRPDVVAVNRLVDDEIARLFKANPVCRFDGRPFFGRHCVDPVDVASATWSNEVVCDGTWDFKRFKLREALRSIPWSRGQTNIDLQQPVIFDADGYTYAVAPPPSPLQAAVLVVGPQYTPRSVWLGVELGLPHMAVRCAAR